MSASLTSGRQTASSSTFFGAILTSFSADACRFRRYVFGDVFGDALQGTQLAFRASGKFQHSLSILSKAASSHSLNKALTKPQSRSVSGPTFCILLSAMMLIILPRSFCLSMCWQNVMRFALVVVLIAAVEGSTIQPFSDCPPGSGPNNPTYVLSTNYDWNFIQSSTYYSAQGLSATYYNQQPTGTADVGGATTPVKAVRENTVDWSTWTYPQSVSVTNGEFSVRWTGFVRSTAPAGYTHTFHTTLGGSGRGETSTYTYSADERVQLWIDNSLVISQWDSLATVYPSGTVSLPVTGAYYSLVMDYKVDTTWSRGIQLKWTSAFGGTEEVVPASLLFPYGNSCSECLSGTYKNMSGAYGVLLSCCRL